ncbi:C40 family peptidase [Arthrobacter roseus]|uniref:C40 family peptidase n=1 Tax=Arthrobacter roseus TaxID=136274 RepID=UPI001963FCB8|nr:C40 family peptidase [Arthrobacter roseus]MBM7847664.1 cell wall-associated NlpC family hydrolase [Arthrobacter roseus]
MTMTDTVGRVQQIQSTLTQLSNPAAARVAQAAPTTTAGPTGAPPASFADALASAASPGADGAAGAAGLASALTGALGSGAVSGPAPVGPDGVNGNSVVETAKKYIGVPYVWGGEDPTGMDCSGFVQWVFKDLGVDVPRVVGDQMNVGSEVNGLANARPGDLLVTLGGNHISFYLGNGKAIDAPQPGKNIAIRDLWETDGNIDTIRRIVPAGGGSTTGAGAAAMSPEALAAAQAAFLSGGRG